EALAQGVGDARCRTVSVVLHKALEEAHEPHEVGGMDRLRADLSILAHVVVVAEGNAERSTAVAVQLEGGRLAGSPVHEPPLPTEAPPARPGEGSRYAGHPAGESVVEAARAVTHAENRARSLRCVGKSLARLKGHDAGSLRQSASPCHGERADEADLLPAREEGADVDLFAGIDSIDDIQECERRGDPG